MANTGSSAFLALGTATADIVTFPEGTTTAFANFCNYTTNARTVTFTHIVGTVTRNLLSEAALGAKQSLAYSFPVIGQEDEKLQANADAASAVHVELSMRTET